MPRSTRPTRRKFLGDVAAAGAVTTLPMRSLWASSPAEQIRVGIVGCGGRGMELLRALKGVAGTKVVGLCDVDQELVNLASKEAPGAKTWTDMRHLFDSPEIDAVVIATCNHWHCLSAIWAMQAGKHVYLEKPLGHTQWEGEQVIHATKRYDRICQVGTQQRSDPMQAELKQFLHEDKSIGTIESVRVNRFGIRRSIGRRAKPLVPPASIDYNLWLGPAQDIPMFRDRLHYDWHWNWNTGSGDMGNWSVHIVDDVRNNVFLDAVAAPKLITAGGGRFAWNDAGTTPNVQLAHLDTGSIPVVIALSNLEWDTKSPHAPSPSCGYVVYGSAGRLEAQRGQAVAFDAEGKRVRKFEGDRNGSTGYHLQEFAQAIREQNPSLLSAPAQVGHDSTTWCNLANIATRASVAPASPELPALQQNFGDTPVCEILEELNGVIARNTKGAESGTVELGSTFSYDTALRQFTGAGAAAANQLLRRKDREPFVVPEITIS